MSGLQPVHVRVNDAATGKPTPCRVRFTDAAGKYYAPYGRLTEFATAYGVDVGGNVLVDGKKYAYIDGSCEIDLPPGVIHVEVHKGPEYKSLNEQIQLLAGKLSLRLTIERWINLREQGWYSGDTRCHFLTPHGALLEGMAEDLAVVNLLAMQHEIPELNEAEDKVERRVWAVPNLLAFSGQRPALEVPGHMVVVNTLNWHPCLGRLALLNCHRVVYPLRFGAPGFDDWTLSDWCDQCHRKGGLVVWTESAKARSEAVADAVLGKIDAIEVDEANWNDWQFSLPNGCLVDAGFHLPVVGGSGKVSNLQLLGGVRTYAHLQPNEPFTYCAWIEAVRTGRVFVTRGPLLQLTVNGHQPGSVLEIAEASSNIHIQVEARSAIPFQCVEVIFPGGVVTAPAIGFPAVATLDKIVCLKSSGAIFARCRPLDKKNQALAFTSPITVCMKTHPQRPLTHGDSVLQQWLHTAVERVQSQGRFANDAQRQRLLGVFEAALQRLGQVSPAD